MGPIYSILQSVGQFSGYAGWLAGLGLYEISSSAVPTPSDLHHARIVIILSLFPSLPLAISSISPSMKHHKYILVTLSLGISSLALPIAMADPSPSMNPESSMYSIQTSPPTPTNVCTKACLQPSATPKCPSQCPNSCIIQQSTDPCCPNSLEAICNDTSNSATSPTNVVTSPTMSSSSLASPVAVSPTTSSPQSSATAHNNAASTDMTSNHALYISTALVAVVFAALLL
ncbi:hypothetical protein BGW37DRAFT_468529 [Umbelopsis sp. PMI_123]|nr:hypothetical protein BGW37DRAFT_468529 [Umbelopsis sp. PMI_123]